MAQSSNNSNVNKGMNMEIKVIESAGEATAFLEGRFDHNGCAKFQQHIIPLVTQAGIKSIRLDFSGVSYLDSSALGTLILLRDKAIHHDHLPVVIAQAHGPVLQVLKVANFTRVMTVE